MLTVTSIVGGDELGAQPLRAAVERADILITTPEKFDSMTRRWRDHRELIGQVELLCVDEVHLLGEDRGATLEAVVTRMRTVSASDEVRARGWPGARLRVIALSATLPNLPDISRWIGARRETTFAFDDSYRPVRLVVTVLGCEPRRSPFLFERSLDARVFDVVRTYGRGRPTLIFCASRSGTQSTAEQLARDGMASAHLRRGGGGGGGGGAAAAAASALARLPSLFLASDEHAARLTVAAARATDDRLASALRAGVGYHNAGESATNRALVERLFLDGELPVLCTTTTLSVGVNFPAYLVVRARPPPQLALMPPSRACHRRRRRRLPPHRPRRSSRARSSTRGAASTASTRRRRSCR